MTAARDAILKRLKSAQQAGNLPLEAGDFAPVDPMPDSSSQELEERFIVEAEKAGIVILAAVSEADAFKHIQDVLGDEQIVLGWTADHIPLSGYGDWLDDNQITLVEEPDGGIKVGITGADATLSTTGSLILISGSGKPRAASLLPDIHIAIVLPGQIAANLESWLAQQRQSGVEAIRDASNVVIVTGPSRTADIGMELVMGAHGPRKLFVILMQSMEPL